MPGGADPAGDTVIAVEVLDVELLEPEPEAVVEAAEAVAAIDEEELELDAVAAELEASAEDETDNPDVGDAVDRCSRSGPHARSHGECLTVPPGTRRYLSAGRRPIEAPSGSGGPERTCIGCRRRFGAFELTRVVGRRLWCACRRTRSRDGEPGCAAARRPASTRRPRRRAFSRALRSEVADEAVAALRMSLWPG